MANFLTCFNWTMGSEDAGRKYATVADPVRVLDTDTPEVAALKRNAQSISGINSYSWPKEFAFINSLPLDQRAVPVQAFYYANFWNHWYAQLTSNDVAKRVFDMAVNGGPGTAVKLLQKAVNDQRGEIWLETDGIWGPLTISEVNDCDPTDLVPVFQQCRIAYYKAIPNASPQLLAEWIARAEK